MIGAWDGQKGGGIFILFGRIFILTSSHVFSFLPGTATRSSYPFRA